MAWSGEVEEEGLFGGGVFLDELDGFVGIATGDGALVDGELDDFLVFHERSVPLCEGAFGVVPKGVHSVRAPLWVYPWLSGWFMSLE